MNTISATSANRQLKKQGDHLQKRRADEKIQATIDEAIEGADLADTIADSQQPLPEHLSTDDTLSITNVEQAGDLIEPTNPDEEHLIPLSNNPGFTMAALEEAVRSPLTLAGSGHSIFKKPVERPIVDQEIDHEHSPPTPPNSPRLGALAQED